MLGHIDTVLFHFVNSTLANPVFDKVMPLLTKLGSGESIFAIALLLIIFGKREKKLAGIFLFAGLTAAYFTTEFLKNAIALPRPFLSMSDVRLLVQKSSGPSFPSGHAITAFMAATILSRFFKAPAVWFTIAFVAAFSRVYIGVHFVSDVVAGSAIGIIIGYSLVKAADHLKIG